MTSARTTLTRRRFIGGAVGLVLSGSAGLGGARAEGDNIEVVRTEVHLARWPKAADGLTIGVISDFHADYDHAVERTGRAASMLQLEQPDIVLLAGDYVSNHLSRRFVAPTVDALSVAVAPLGSYAIMGNHDCWGNTHELTSRLLQTAGFEVLNNRSSKIPGQDNLYIVGLDDAWCGRMDIQEALADVPNDAVKIVALHEPDFADSIGPGFDLQLSGHSHGGQIRLPGLPVLHAPMYGTKYPEGLQRAQNHLVYTTRGIGMIGPQVRTFCAPEVTILTLRSASTSSPREFSA